MTDQLSLFPTYEVEPRRVKTIPQSEISALDEMITACQKFRNSRTYKKVLRFISKFSQYSTFNGFLLYVQHPTATYVATAAAWERRYGRKIQPGAHPLMILAPMAPVLFLFDIEDTSGDPIDSGQMKAPVVRGRLLQEAYDKTIENCSVHGIDVREAPSSDERTGQAITLNYNTRQQYKDLRLGSESKYLCVLQKDHTLEFRYATLVCGLGHIFCGHLGIDNQAWWQDRRGTGLSIADMEAESVAFLSLRRKGLEEPSGRYLSGFSDPDRLLPALSLNAVFQATQYIEDMGKSLWQVPKKRSRYL